MGAAKSPNGGHRWARHLAVGRSGMCVPAPVRACPVPAGHEWLRPVRSATQGRPGRVAAVFDFSLVRPHPVGQVRTVEPTPPIAAFQCCRA